MKQVLRIFFICLLMLQDYTGFSQSAPYGNEWINYNLTYYKFKVGTEGIYRINKNALDAAGVPASVQGGNFMLFRNGQELRIRTSTNGTFGGGDYIEFYGTGADGFLDRQLYENPSWQASDKTNLFTDTAAYFLTYDNNINHLRYAQVPNNIPANPPAALPYCWHIEGRYYKNDFLPGTSHHPTYLLHSSRFEAGEGFVESETPLHINTTTGIATPNFSTVANATIKTSLLAVALTNQKIPVKLLMNNQLIADSTLSLDTERGITKQFSVSFPASYLSTTNVMTVQPSPSASTGYQQYGVAFTEIEYPHNFTVTGQILFTFKLDASSNARYIEFNNFNHGGIPPILYDQSTGVWYSGDISVPGKTRFYINAAFTERNFVLVSQASSAVKNVSSSVTRNFTDYTSAANQGNYIIVSHRNYMASPNYVQDYASYRNSVNGGGYTPVVADVTELYDQFAYGNEIHPLSIKNFVRYAYDKWNVKPENLFIIGRGLLYHKYPQYKNNPSLYTFPIVPTYGDPGSDVDFVNFGPNKQQVVHVGRLSAWNTQEIKIYLQKIKGYEAALQVPASPTYATELWKKRALHIAGGSDIALQQGILLPTLNGGAAIIRDTFTGKLVTTVAKNTSSPIDPFGSKTVDSLINSGVSIITFHGHSSPGGFDFNLNNPEQYNNSPKLSAFVALGCDVAQIFELSTQKTISERYLDAPNGGSITMIAQDILGFPDFHQRFLFSFYRSHAYKDYGQREGKSYTATYNDVLTTNNSNYIFSQLEGTLFLGDPATAMYNPDKPDYHVSADGISSIPFNVTTSQDSFKLNIIAYNLAKATNDSITVRIEHVNPAGATQLVTDIRISKLYSSDTILVSVPINKLADLGLNKYLVTIDATNTIDETSETNNTATFNLFIYSDNLVPIYPQEFSIVGKQGITLKASTLNPFRPMGRYKIEIDTTELFNSSLKQQTTISSKGGVVKWTPTISYIDSTVYYWRTAYDSTINGNYQWTTSSFIYIPQTSGWNQSHFYQFKKNDFKLLSLENNRRFRYPIVDNKLEVTNAVLVFNDPNWPYGTTDVEVKLNEESLQRSGCAPYVGTIQIYVFDSATAEPWENPVNGTGGSYPRCFTTRNKNAFEFPLNTITDRNNASAFLKSIPDGNYVLIRNFIYKPFFQPAYVDDWKNDTLSNGSGNSLYHTIRDMGFNMIDSYNKERVFVLFNRKGNSSYPIRQFFTTDINGRIDETFNFTTSYYAGDMTSKVVGPALQWSNLLWRTTTLDNLPQNDSTYVQITGIENSGQETVLYTGDNKNLSLSFINATTYPKLRLQWYSYDSVNRSSPQLNYWRVLYSPAPEAALNPAGYFSFNDSLQVGQQLDFSVAIENLTDIPMDSMLVRYRIIDRNGVTHNIADKRYKPLGGEDTLHARLSVDPSTYAGSNVFFIEANPDNDQPEQYHPNNLGYLPFNVQTDNFNPLIDVTFDGVHILDRDIVSAKPFIKISLKDENKYLKLDDTSLINLFIRYPNDGPSVRRGVPLDGTIATFIPASGSNNEAYIEYRPTFEQDGIYELIVNGEDKSGNVADINDYRVSFEVINKSTITNLLNYPNPFSTATSFLFTITGSQIPSQFKIQIMTVTGKVVREITKHELGPLHIGRNRTEYQWDGKDQYGQMLGNGVYLYRVVTTINGSGIEHRQSAADKYFKNGWGKMYIMR